MSRLLPLLLLLLSPGLQVEWFTTYLAAQEEEGFIGTFGEFLQEQVGCCCTSSPCSLVCLAGLLISDRCGSKCLPAWLPRFTGCAC
jgi:hypothetical protein